MSVFNYVDLGAGLPPAPIVSMSIYPPEWERQLTENLCYSCTAFLDIGSDCTLIPLEAISAHIFLRHFFEVNYRLFKWEPIANMFQVRGLHRQ